jgi:prepilin-type N-terminal cleavage/methylation domain-containing protein
MEVRRNEMKVPRGFTLIELLVVIAIIAVLAAILFPVFAKAREQAKTTACLSQMKQLALSVDMYADSQNAALPPSSNYGAPTTDPKRVWPPLVQPYVKDKSVFLCPAAERAAYAADWDSRSWQPIGYNSATAYDPTGCDPAEQGHRGCEGFISIVRLPVLKEPARIPLFADTPHGPRQQKYRAYVFDPYNGNDHPTEWGLGLPLVSDRDLVIELNDRLPSELKPVYCRHGRTGKDEGKTTIIFADGHAKQYSAASILAMDKGANLIWRFR